MFATGTGIAPFASLIRDPETYEKFAEVILTHTCRNIAELKYGKVLVESLADDPLIGELIDGKLKYYPTITQENFKTKGRITNLLSNGQLFSDLCIKEMSAESDRAMICGSMGLNNDMRKILEARGLSEGANSRPAEYVLEKAFVG